MSHSFPLSSLHARRRRRRKQLDPTRGRRLATLQTPTKAAIAVPPRAPAVVGEGGTVVGGREYSDEDNIFDEQHTQLAGIHATHTQVRSLRMPKTNSLRLIRKRSTLESLIINRGYANVF